MDEQIYTTQASYDRIAAPYLERTRDRSVVKDAMQRFTQRIEQDTPILDVGCGNGLDSALLQEHGFQTISIDLSIGMMLAGRSEYSGKFVQADMRHLPFGAVIAGIWANASLPHLQQVDFAATLTEFHRITRPNGLLYLSVKEGNGEGWVDGNYTTGAPRWFTYWQDQPLNEALEYASFRLIDSWTIGSDINTWLCRLARRI